MVGYLRCEISDLINVPDWHIIYVRGVMRSKRAQMLLTPPHSKRATKTRNVKFAFVSWVAQAEVVDMTCGEANKDNYDEAIYYIVVFHHPVDAHSTKIVPEVLLGCAF